jgi:circadian clock protein KaiC
MALSRSQEIERVQRQLERRRTALESQIAALRAEFEAEEEELRKRLSQEEARETRLYQDRREMAHSRKSDTRFNGPAEKGC